MINTPSRQKRKRGQSVWTPERRAAAAERARRLKPSRFSTGPKTAAGKARSSLNAWKHGFYCKGAKDLRSALRRHNQFLKDINKMIVAARRGNLLAPSAYPPFGDKTLLSHADPAIKGACFPNKTK